MPEILLPDTSSITSSSSTASSLLLYTDHQTTTLTRRKSLPLRRLSVWLSRRISKQGLNATYDSSHNHTHTHTLTLTQDENYTDDDYNKIMSDLNRERERERDRNRNRKIKEYEAERILSESYAAYCRAFTSAGEHLYHQKRRTWMMDGEADLTMISEDSVHGHGHPEDDDEEEEEEEEEEGGVLDEKRETPEAVPSAELEPSPPPHILTPSLYAEMRRAACDKKRARKRLRERRLWSWFSCIRQRESH